MVSGRVVLCTNASRGLGFDFSVGRRNLDCQKFCLLEKFSAIVAHHPNSTEENQGNEGTFKIKAFVSSLASICIPLLRHVNWHPIRAGAAKEWTTRRSVPTIWTNVSQAHLRRVLRNTFSSHNRSLLSRAVLAYRRKRHRVAGGARTVRTQG